MGKNYISVILMFLLFALTVNVNAQQIPLNIEKQKELNSFSTQSQQRFTNSYQKAISIAPIKGWTVKRIDKAGNTISLQGINSYGFPVYITTHNNSIAAATTGTRTVQPGGGLNLNLAGSSTFLNNKLAIWDGGQVYKLHNEFAGKNITAKDNAEINRHSTHVAGTMIAKGVYAPAKGMAYGAGTLSAWDFDDDVSEMSAAASGLLLSNHSYGDVGGWDYNTDESRWEWYGLPGDTEDYNFGFYDSRVQAWDKIAYKAPYYLIVESAGNSRSSNGPPVGGTYYGFTSRTNSTIINKGARPANISNNNGYDIITTTGNAKNILTVGSVAGLSNGPVKRSDLAISYFSSWGPTDDGRIKPDIVGDGENILSTGIQNPDSYITLSGTSMAAPNITGSLYLLQEYYYQKNNGLFIRSATLKGLACHTAFDGGNVGPDYIYGWGLLDMRKAAKAITDNGVKSIINEDVLTQGQTKTFDVVASGEGPLIVSISWTDPEGTPTAGTTINDRTPKLVNDLDLRLTNAGSTYMPWVLNPDNPSMAATNSDNIRDNMEQVYVANAVPGKKYTITISHKGVLRSGSQPYSVIATGVGGSAYCTSAPISTADSKVTAFSLANINKTFTTGCTGYTDNTNLAIELESGKAYPFSITLGTCGANFNKAAKIFADWNGNGVFDADELAYTTNVVGNTQTISGSIIVPGTVTPGNTTLLRVVLNETNTASSIEACGNYGKGETQDYRVLFLKPAIDAGAIAIVNAGGTCETQVPITVRLKNFGTATITGISVSVKVTSPNNAVTNIAETFTGTLQPEEETDFTLNTKFNAVAGSMYTVTAETNLALDPVNINNKATGIININYPPELSNLIAYYCSIANSYQLSGDGDGLVFWYKNATDVVPVGYGSPAIVSQTPVNNTFYAGLNDFTGNTGAATKKIFNGGGYSQFTPGVQVSTKVPVVIESARLYIGNSGRVNFTVTNDNNGQIVSSVTINVAATRSVALPGEQLDDLNDEGKVYTLNLLLPSAGNYTITPTYENGATIYRSNQAVTGYPFSVGDIFSITGNTATQSDNGQGDSNYYKTLYYYFYDMQVHSPGCASVQRKPVLVTKPVITQNGDVLTSSLTQGNQWMVNGVVIDGAMGTTYRPLVSGNYQVQVTLNEGCISLSDNFAYALLPKNADKTTEIGLTVFPVPADTYLNVLFEAKFDADLQLSVINASGHIVYQESQKVIAGNYSRVVNTSSFTPGSYMVKVNLSGKVYAKKVIITR